MLDPYVIVEPDSALIPHLEIPTRAYGRFPHEDGGLHVTIFPARNITLHDIS